MKVSKLLIAGCYTYFDICKAQIEGVQSMVHC